MYFAVDENKSVYSIPGVVLSDAGRYVCQVKNKYGEMNSKVSRVVVMSNNAAPQHEGYSQYNISSHEECSQFDLESFLLIEKLLDEKGKHHVFHQRLTMFCIIALKGAIHELLSII